MEIADLIRTPLFRGVEEGAVKEILACLGAERRQFAKDQVICRAGDTVTALGLVLVGSVSIENDDFWGNRSILDRVEAGQVFAETYACVPGEPLMVSAVAAEPSEILFLTAARLLAPCAKGCTFHTLLIRNLVAISAQKNLRLSRRIFHTSAKTIRGRLLSYLSYQAALAGGGEFEIPFNRQQLADYLGVDRSALSAELGKMRREGLLETDRQHFRLLGEPL